jgi:hypothetical protein
MVFDLDYKTHFSLPISPDKSRSENIHSPTPNLVKRLSNSLSISNVNKNNYKIKCYMQTTWLWGPPATVMGQMKSLIACVFVKGWLMANWSNGPQVNQVAFDWVIESSPLLFIRPTCIRRPASTKLLLRLVYRGPGEENSNSNRREEIVIVHLSKF